MKLVCNPIEALMTGNYLGILFWAVIVGIILRTTASEGTLKMCEDVSDTLVKVIRGIISFAPFGILGLIYESVSTNGMDIFVDYGHLILLLVAAMLIVMFITNPLIVFITTRRNPYPLLFACIKGSAITAFFTRSSAANIPMNLALCEKMGVDKELYSTSIPLGATINMNGAAITITVMTLAAAFTLGVDVPIYMAILLCIVSAFAACGASGVGGGSLLLIPLACSLLGISDTIAAQLIAIGFIIGVIQDSLETALNSSADAYFTAAAEIHENPDKELNL
jgi:serine/threonine transporter